MPGHQKLKNQPKMEKNHKNLFKNEKSSKSAQKMKNHQFWLKIVNIILLYS